MGASTNALMQAKEQALMQGHIWVSPPPVITSYKNNIIWFTVPTTSKELVLVLALY